ncbi:alpha/beta fold hydrolase [Lapillicoccus jejuensis]|uniref:Pimeloyl-ACP methyl ester carboxylesterase n=1 Tax=Lapillicoccus jejuensis TaxID=402171 RepID=A0A542E100_9MICO|nr:alpha/beta fold hydrolase [Lapillicoccus jejuensis]TQJ09031.1 pimeloyl-ACP methyl ester carboxylesterase [Lapillicoccus jejuensis]
MTDTTATTLTLDVPTSTSLVPLRVADRGSGRPVLLLHGGAGPTSVAPLAEALTASYPVRVVTPVHPGFDGTPRPEGVGSVGDLADAYVALLDVLGLEGVTVVGSSLGGWVAAEVALRHSPRVAAVVLVGSVGLADDADPIADFFALDLDEVVERSYHPAHRDAARAALAAMPEAARALVPGNRAALLAYGGATMADPTLRARLTGVTVPVRVLWGAHDRIVPPSHGRGYAEAVPGATLRVLDEAGHLPPVEVPEVVAADVWAFAGVHPPAR